MHVPVVLSKHHDVVVSVNYEMCRSVRCSFVETGNGVAPIVFLHCAVPVCCADGDWFGLVNSAEAATQIVSVYAAKATGRPVTLPALLAPLLRSSRNAT